MKAIYGQHKKKPASNACWYFFTVYLTGSGSNGSAKPFLFYSRAPSHSNTVNKGNRGALPADKILAVTHLLRAKHGDDVVDLFGEHALF